MEQADKEQAAKVMSPRHPKLPSNNMKEEPQSMLEESKDEVSVPPAGEDLDEKPEETKSEAEKKSIKEGVSDKKVNEDIDDEDDFRG